MSRRSPTHPAAGSCASTRSGSRAASPRTSRSGGRRRRARRARSERQLQGRRGASVAHVSRRPGRARDGPHAARLAGPARPDDHHGPATGSAGPREEADRALRAARDGIGSASTSTWSVRSSSSTSRDARDGDDMSVSRRAVVLGGTGPIGRATALRLLEAGWHVDVTGRDPAHMPEDVGRAGCRFVASDRADARRLEAVLAATGPTSWSTASASRRPTRACSCRSRGTPRRR